MIVKASVKYLNISPRKVRVVVDVLRGMEADKALSQLEFMKKGAARPVKKLLDSAIANAEHNFSLDRKTLKIATIKVDGGPALKRFRPKGFGRAAPIAKRTSHVTVELEGKQMSEKDIAERNKALAKGKAPTSETKVSDTSGQDTKKDKAKIEEVVEAVKKTPRADYDLEKKVGKEQKPSFVKRMFRRKSI